MADLAIGMHVTFSLATMQRSVVRGFRRLTFDGILRDVRGDLCDVQLPDGQLLTLPFSQVTIHDESDAETMAQEWSQVVFEERHEMHNTWLHVHPRWLRRTVSAASKRLPRSPKLFRGPWSNSEAINWIMSLDSAQDVVDHWGSERDRLVFEPYAAADDPAFIAKVKWLADLLDCDFDVNAEAATWFPGRTVRVELWPKVKVASN
jgi:hypothetical protein